MSSENLGSTSGSPAGRQVAARPEIAISVRHLGKCYRIYDRPQDRLKQALRRGRRQYFREFWALRDVSLEIRRGETVGIIGRNGCGKSTLLQLICNTLTPTVGQIEIHGRIAALLELGAGFNPEFSGRDNVYTNAAILGLSPDEIDARYPDIVAFAELGDFIDRPVKTYSSGMYVRLAFAVAISVDPDILVVDEALAVGDEAFQRKCYARIQAIQRRGGTILFVSHAAGTIIELCNRAVLLDQGEHLLSGRPKTVVAKYHKLLYAPAEKLPAIREETKRSAETDESCVREPATVPAAPPPETSGAYYDPEMKPKSTVIYQSIGAEILDPWITTPAGRRVNVLVPHEEYVVRYRVQFTKASFQVRFGTMIKTIQGAELSSMATRVPRVYLAPDSQVQLAFKFRCLLMPGVYFANVGLVGVADGRETFLHRMEDGLMFRVLHGDHRSVGGPVDIFLDSQLTFLSAGAEEAA